MVSSFWVCTPISNHGCVFLDGFFIRMFFHNKLVARLWWLLMHLITCLVSITLLSLVLD